MYFRKYRAKPTTIDNIKFASRLEANYYLELKMLKKVGVVKDIKLQPRFLLQEGFKKNNKYYRPIHYVADFEVKYANHTEIVELKGYETAVWKIKQKMFEYKYKDLKLKVVK